MFEDRYPPRRPAATATSAYKKPDQAIPPDARVRLTPKGAMLLREHAWHAKRRQAGRQ